MKTIQIKDDKGSVLFTHTCEGNNIRLTLEVAIKSRTNLSDANLSRTNLSGANLSGANLSRANLSRTNLSDANLSRTNLSRTNLSDANLSGAYIKNAEKLVGSRPILQIGPIGSRCAYFVAYITDKGLRFDAGCQHQITREVFEARMAELHGENEHAREYRAALALIDVHAEIWATKNADGNG